MRSCIIYYHGNDWSWTQARQQYLMAAMSRYVDVIYLDNSYASKGRVTFRQVTPHVTVVKGLVPMMRAMERRKLTPMIPLFAAWKLARIRRGYDRVMFWNAESASQPYRFIRHDRLIYDCIDPPFNNDPGLTAAVIVENDRREIEQIERADLVFASAASLQEHCARHHKRVILLNNACEPAEYDAALVHSAPCPAWWPSSDRPVAAYLGTIDWRVDLNLLHGVCAANPHLSFIVAGHVLPHLQDKMRALAQLPNVVCPGRIDVPEGRFVLSRCAVGLIPFTPGEMNDAINPVKMYAYALLGKPVVGTTVRELKTHPKFVDCADTVDAFSIALRNALVKSNDPEAARRLTAIALANTWEGRAAEAWPVLQWLGATARPAANQVRTAPGRVS